jgi:K+-transporting ATPase ATPase A chain
VLLGTALAVMVERRRGGLFNPGAHGFSEVLYAFTSAGNNNGSAFAGLSANTPFYNVLLGIAMWLGRFGVIVPVLAMAGALAAKKRMPPRAGTMPTHGPLFVGLLIGTGAAGRRAELRAGAGARPGGRAPDALGNSEPKRP